MADRGLTISESVGLKQAKLVVPAFTKGKSQLDPADVERTKGIDCKCENPRGESYWVNNERSFGLRQFCTQEFRTSF